MNVYKQYLDIKQLQEIKLPIMELENDIVKVAISKGKPCLWFLNKSCEEKVIIIHSYMTGETIPEDVNLKYLGNYDLDSQILIHLFAEELK